MKIEPLQLTLAILHAVHDAGGEDEARSAVERLIAQAAGGGDEDIDESVQSGDFTNITGQDILPRRQRIEESAHKYASTQIDLPTRLADAARALAARIPPADLAEDGVEDCPHLTVLFGLHGRVTHRDVCAAARKCRGVRLRLGETKYFPDSESGSGDVVYVAVEDAGGLSELRAALESLPHTPTHPEYVPHVTLAYVKAGLGKKYAGMADLAGREWSCGSLLHSDRDRRKAVVPLAGDALAESAARGVRGLGKGGRLTPAQRARLLEAGAGGRTPPRPGLVWKDSTRRWVRADGGKKTSRNKVAKTASSARIGSSPARSEEKSVSKTEVQIDAAVDARIKEKAGRLAHSVTVKELGTTAGPEAEDFYKRRYLANLERFRSQERARLAKVAAPAAKARKPAVQNPAAEKAAKPAAKKPPAKKAAPAAPAEPLAKRLESLTDRTSELAREARERGDAGGRRLIPDADREKVAAELDETLAGASKGELVQAVADMGYRSSAKRMSREKLTAHVRKLILDGIDNYNRAQI